jgi:DNA-binding protein H-NS
MVPRTAEAAKESFMPDEQRQRGAPDPERINIDEAHQVTVWSKKFGVTPEQLKAAVKKVGNRVSAVEAELGSGPL